MNTLQKYYEKIKEDDEKKRAFVEAMRAGKAEDFLRESGCDVTAEELEEFLAGTARQEEPLELSDDEIKEVAGGSTIHSETCYCTDGTCGCSDTCIRDCC